MAKLEESEIQKIVREAITEGMAMGVAMAAKSQPQMQARGTAPIVQKCHECGQAKTGCLGKHRMMVVYPQNAQKWGRFFQGIWINGVRYLSSNAQEKVLVPEGPSIEHMIAEWEGQEEAQKDGKDYTHNSGVMSGSGKSSFNPATSSPSGR